MNRRQEAIDRIKAAFNGHPLQEVAITAILSCWSQGYCEITEDKELLKLIGDLYCPWCGRFHTRDVDHQYHAKLSAITSEQWAAAQEKFGYYSFETLAEKAGYITDRPS